MGKKKGDPKAAKAPGEPVYTVMAFITFVGLAIGCTLLYLDYDEYGKQTGPTEKVPALSKLGDATATSTGLPTTPPPMTPMAPPGM